MTRRSIGIALAGAILGCAVACSSADGTDAAGVPSEAGVPEGATSEADASIDGPPSRFCAGEPVQFCDDFEDGELGQRWSSRGQSAPNVPLLSRVPNDGGHALRVAVPADAPSTVDDKLLRADIPALGRYVRLEVSLTVAAPPPGYMQLAMLAIEPGRPLLVVLAYDSGKLRVEVIRPDPPVILVVPTIDAPEGETHRFVLELDLTSGAEALAVNRDGQSLVSYPLGDVLFPGDASFEALVGAIYHSAPGAELSMDDIVIDWK